MDLERRIITVRNTKGGEDREIPINDRLLEILTQLDRNHDSVFRYDRHYVTHKFKAYVRLASVNPRATVHSLRHTFASHLVMNGVDLYTVSKLLGHSDIRVTEMYAHLAPDYLGLAVNKLPYSIW